MTTQRVDVGTVANDDTGDTIRASFQKCNSNFDELDINTADITTNTTNISTNTASISTNATAIATKATDTSVLKKDGSVALDAAYNPSNDKDISTKDYVDAATTGIATNTSNISSNTSAIASKANTADVLKKDGSVALDGGYAPSSSLDIATKTYVDTNTSGIATNTSNISSNTSAIAGKANTDDVLKKDGTVALNNGYAPNADLDIATKEYVDDSVAAVEGGSGASETNLLTLSTGTEKFSDGVADTHQDDWNTRAKNKIEANTTSLGSKATQADLTTLTNRVTTTENNTTTNTASINGLATVANSGSYTDLSNKPSIPANVSDLSNDSGFVANLSTFDTDDLSEGSSNLYDKTVALTGGTDISISGTYPNFTINSTSSGGGSDPTLISGGVPTNDGTDPDTVINLTKIKARSDDDTQDIEIDAGSLDITDGSNWADGIDRGFINLLPTMTSTTSPTGNTTRASQNNADSYLVFDGTSSEYNSNALLSLSDYIDIQTDTSFISKLLIIKGSTTTSDSLKSFKLQGSNDGSSWTDIYTEAGDLSWTASEIKTFDISANTTSYSDYRLTDMITVAGGYARIVGVEISDSLLIDNASVHLWADYNSGTERFVFDDATGSNISGAKRYRWSFLTDADGDIIPWDIYGEGKRLEAYYKTSIVDISALTSSYVDYDLTVPDGIKLKPIVKVKGDTNTLYGSYDGTNDIYQGTYNTDLELLTSDASVKLKKSSGTTGVGNTLGYIIES